MGAKGRPTHFILTSIMVKKKSAGNIQVDDVYASSQGKMCGYKSHDFSCSPLRPRFRDAAYCPRSLQGVINACFSSRYCGFGGKTPRREICPVVHCWMFLDIFQLFFQEHNARNVCLPYPDHAKFGEILDKLEIVAGAKVFDYQVM
jgi:hypothetical protein